MWILNHNPFYSDQLNKIIRNQEKKAPFSIFFFSMLRYVDIMKTKPKYSYSTLKLNLHTILWNMIFATQISLVSPFLTHFKKQLDLRNWEFMQTDAMNINEV